MDEEVGDEVAAVDAVGGRYLRGKDGEYSGKADGASMLESHEMIIPSEGQYHRGSSPTFATILEDNNQGLRGVLQLPCLTPHCMNDTGVMVEELTLRNYNGENLATVGTSKNRDIMQTRQNPWQHLYQIAGGLGSGSSREDALYKDCVQATATAWEDVGYTDFSDFLGRKPPDDSLDDDTELLPNNENKVAASNMLTPPAGIRTKILSKSGFSEYFVKNTLKGKGVIFKGPAREGFGTEFSGQTHPKAAGTPMVAFDAPLSLSSKTITAPSCGGGSGVGICLNAFNDGVNLRDWLKAGNCKAKKMESLCIFRLIVDFVDVSHSQGVALKDIRPSCFKLLQSNQVIYLGSPVQQETGENLTNQDNLLLRNDRHEKRILGQAMHLAAAKKQKFEENLNNIKQCPQFPSRSGFRNATADDTDVSIIGSQDSWNELNKDHKLKRDYKRESNSSSPHVCNTSQLLSPYPNDPLEEKWYTSPEENSGRECTSSSNIYVLGVLLFELLVFFDTERARAAAMSDLHYRILPPSFLSENPKEAGFCLWLLHPEPSSRPTAREVLQSDFMSGIVESFGDNLSSSIDEDDTESELLSHFLLSLKEEKQKDALKLVEAIKCLESDIEEVERRQTKNPLVISCSSKESLHAWGNRFQYNEYSSSEVHSKSTTTKDELRLMKNMDHLESAYFSTRSNIQLSDDDVVTRTNKELLEERDNGCQVQKEEERHKPMDRLGAFFSGLCKYARYSKFKVRGTLRNGDFHNSANVICSLSFDRDQEYFAAAGVSKRIKIFEFQALFNESVDIHYPAIEMSNKSRLSCICWNSYIRNYLASTDYDGIVKLWDAGTGQGFSQFAEHNKRAWSVDFSQVDPTKLASGSDDCSVKLWNINERNNLCTIRNIANICCVQFSPHSAHLLAFGSSDYKTYCYDLRNVSSPWCILAGHDKAVSFVKFLDSETVISASTDNTLKLWDLNKTSSSRLSTTACVSTLKGHTNEKNFIGLSVADGYIACGSETNEVYSYYRSLPMPITSHKFGSIDPISSKETDDDNGQFVSSVCWRKNSDMLIAASSSGCIKVLQMV
ncbi:protein SPA1-RELATED 2-like isoform X1 [Actinidia eriantha]|uniref:protein SPA1-RELATED 2-like isoform X1 n=1 Tax=Actinidia eriantha TaxID=165200 RepID=UPI00258F227F|nr:protein SPA1-RELATED 2-like isoform X1 [Actinidia eriantha]